MNFDEKFIDKNIAELSKQYDLIFAANVNIARMIPTLIDGLNPVKRRALYIMSLKDGGKTFRKVASIAGDVFGRVHPHCLHGDTEFILTNGTKKSISQLYKEQIGKAEIMTYDIRNKNITRAPMHSIRITKHVTEYHEIKLTNGGSIKCTNDHCILVMRPSDRKTKFGELVYKPTWVRADEIVSGDVIYGGEISNLSFEGKDVGYPQMFVPFENRFLENSGGRSFVIHREFTIDPRLINHSDGKKWTIHHKNYNKNDFSKDNLVVMDNSEHNKLHTTEDDEKISKNLAALEQGRYTLSHDSFIKAKMKIRNAEAIRQINKYLPLFKSFKIIDSIINDSKEPTAELYDEYRVNSYNSSSIESLFSRGYIEENSFDSLMDLYRSNTKNKYVKFNTVKNGCIKISNEKAGKLIGLYKSIFRRIYSRVITNKLPLVREHFISGIHKPEKSNIWDKCIDAGINVDNMLDELKYSFIQVESVNVIKTDEPVPMYDFTVSEYANGAIYCGSRDESHHSFAIVKNSPTSIESAIVGMGQAWCNSIPLIEPKGNYGSVAGDRAGASRYIQARLSEFAIDCFFSDPDSVVDMELAYDEETKMPIYLPAKYPIVLLNGANGIGHMGVSSNIPCFNFREVVEATIQLMMNPKSNIMLIPDSAAGASIVQTDFAKLCNTGRGSYSQRCTYEIDDATNTIKITSLPDGCYSNEVRAKVADIKEKGGLQELISMNDLSGEKVDLRFIIRDDVNPYKFMKKLISSVPGFQQTYPVTVTIINNFHAYDWSIKDVLLEWIKWRREQKHVVISKKRSNLTAEQRINDIKLFIMNKENLEETIKIFRSSHNREEIEHRLIERYHNTAIRLDSLQARALSNMRMIELTIDAYESYKAKAKELESKLKEIEEIMHTENGVDKIIIAELRQGIKKFGTPRRSNVVPVKIETSSDAEGYCILQLTSDGTILRKPSTNVEEEPIPTDCNGFACVVDNDSSFVILDEDAHHTFIKVNDIPIDTEVPIYRFTKKTLGKNIVAMLPVDIDSDLCCLVVSKKGMMKKFRINDVGTGKKPIMSLEEGDKLVKGIVVKDKSKNDILVYTENGLGQRLDPNSVKVTSPSAKGTYGFKISSNDRIIGIYAISPDQNQFILYVTMKGKMRLNNLQYLPTRESKKDSMVKLISLPDRDKLISVLGCNKFDKVQVYFDDGTSENVKVDSMDEETMSAEPKKLVKKNMLSSKIVKAKIL